MADIKKLLLKEPDKVRRMAKDIFNELDLDSSGAIDREEMKTLLLEMSTQLGKAPPTDAEIDKEIDKYDTDGNGEIDADEFTAVVMDILKDMAGL